MAAFFNWNKQGIDELFVNQQPVKETIVYQLSSWILKSRNKNSLFSTKKGGYLFCERASAFPAETTTEPATSAPLHTKAVEQEIDLEPTLPDPALQINLVSKTPKRWQLSLHGTPVVLTEPIYSNPIQIT